MKSIITKSLLTLSAAFLLISCGDDPDPGPTPTGNSKTYTLSERAVAGISGTVTFIENSDNSVTIDLDLANTPDGGLHPAHIHFNSAAEGGGIALSLADVDGDTGESSITITELDDTSPVTYTDLLGFDGYVNVHLSATELGTIVAQGDIGINELTGNSKSYDLNSVAVPEISGSVVFEERVSGEALATITLQNTPMDGSHPAHIHDNTAVEGGDIAFTFNPVDGDNGVSITHVAELDDSTPFGYAELLDFNGYINVHLSETELATIVAQGDIGQNELTGESTVYDLNEKDVPGISGTATFEERVNGSTLVTLNLIGTPDGGEHPAHIHENDAATTGGIVVTLNSVNGTTGISKTQVSQLDDNTSISYTELLSYDGYINVHLSAAELSTIVAQGNIGSNAGMGTTIEYAVTNSGSSAYIFNGSGLTDASNPNITLTRGMTYVFTVSTPGHPFYINSTQGTGSSNAYNNGVTNNGASSGTITFTVPNDAPNTLFYNCEFHSSMTGQFNIVD